MMTVNGNIRWQKGVETAAQRRQAQEQKPPYRQREGHCRLLSTIGVIFKERLCQCFSNFNVHKILPGHL